MDEKNYKAIIEAILFTMGESVELDKLADALELDNKTTKAIIEEMMEEWEKEGRGVAIMELDGAYQMCTRTEMYEYLIRIAKQPKKRVLTDVLLETLSIIAYKQPVTRAYIDRVRGVDSGHTVSSLADKGLISSCGRLDVPGRPNLYATTEKFLRSFGLSDLEELPYIEGFVVEHSAEQLMMDLDTEETGKAGETA